MLAFRCCCSVAKSCLTLCNPVNCSSPGFPVLQNLSVCSDSRPLSWWSHPTISFSIIPSSSWPQSFPAWGSFPRSQLFTSGGQSIWASASASVLPMNIKAWFSLGWTGLISLQSKGLSSSPAPQFKSNNSSALSFLYGPTLTWLLEKPQLWLYGSLSAKWSLCFLICCLGLS